MARRTPLTSLRRMSEINLTPLMDLTFILLITFVITFPLIEQGIPVNLPDGKATDLSSVEAQTITIDLEGGVYLEDVALTLDQLRERMNLLGQTAPSVTVFVRADESIRYGRLTEVLQILHGAHLSKLALVTRGEEDAGR